MGSPERLFGSWAFVLLYFAAGLGGSLASLVWNPAVNSAGASSAIFGVYGGMLAFFLRRHAAIPASVIKQQLYSGMVFIGYNLLNGFSHAGIDNADHVGGLAVGFVLGLVLARPLDLAARQANQTSFYLKGAVSACALVGALFIAVHFSPAGNRPDQQFRRDIATMARSEKEAHQLLSDGIRLILPDHAR
jgi:rhomboid protease GluP